MKDMFDKKRKNCECGDEGECCECSSGVGEEYMNPAYDIYYDEQRRRIIDYNGEVNMDSALSVCYTIERYNAEDKGKDPSERTPIKLFINTEGGDVQAALAMTDTITHSKTPVYTIVRAEAMSAGAHILAAGHKRFAYPGAVILVHSGSVFMGGDVEKAESMRKYYKKMSDRFNKEFLDRTKVSATSMKKKGAVDWYLDAEEALAEGIIDTIVADIDEVL